MWFKKHTVQTVQPTSTPTQTATSAAVSLPVQSVKVLSTQPTQPTSTPVPAATNAPVRSSWWRKKSKTQTVQAVTSEDVSLPAPPVTSLPVVPIVPTVAPVEVAVSVPVHVSWWQVWKQEHQIIGWIVTAIISTVSYFFSGKWIVDFVRWMVTTGGTIAESAFLLATVYVTVTMVARPLVMWLLPNPGTIPTLNQIAVVTFSVLPELIIFSAAKVTFDHWKLAWSSKTWDKFAWAIAYTLPTLTFLGLTVATIMSFVSLKSINAADATQVTGVMLQVRVLAGWFYGLVQMLFATVGKQGYHETYTRLQQREADVTTLVAQNTTLSNELTTLRVAMANRRVSHRQSDVTQVPLVTLAHGNGNVTPMSIVKSTTDKSEKYHKVKRHLESAILAGEKVNLKKTAKETGVSYNSVRRYSDEIIAGMSTPDTSSASRHRDADTAAVIVAQQGEATGD